MQDIAHRQRGRLHRPRHSRQPSNARPCCGRRSMNMASCSSACGTRELTTRAEVRYLDLEDLLRCRPIGHGRRTRGARRRTARIGAVHRPSTTLFGEDAYPTLSDKAAALLESMVRNHGSSTATNARPGSRAGRSCELNGPRLAALTTRPTTSSSASPRVASSSTRRPARSNGGACRAELSFGTFEPPRAVQTCPEVSRAGGTSRGRRRCRRRGSSRTSSRGTARPARGRRPTGPAHRVAVARAPPARSRLRLGPSRRRAR